jgi:5-dehydro-4-deoxyglucarate dehydratase
MQGIICFPLTPFTADDQLDLAALERDVADLTQYPFCAINAPAGISEIFSLSVAEAVAVVRKTVELARGKMPVIGSVCFNAAIAAEMARGMEAAGADALLVLPPYYQQPPEEGLLAYYRAIGRACGLPLIVYSRGWAAFTPEQVARLADAVPTLRYWKDGQADARVYQRIMARLGDRLVWIGGAGDDCAAMYAAIGVRAFTSSVSAILPRLALAWGEAALAGDFARLNMLLARYVHPLFALRARKRGYEVAVMKKAAELLGKPCGAPRPPIPELSAAEVDELRALLEACGEFR